MPDLATTYASVVRPSLVAFFYKFHDTHTTAGQLPPFPTIIGTGFVIDSDGWIATNRHVAEAFAHVPNEVRQVIGDQIPVMAVLFQLVDGNLHLPMFQVEDVITFDVPQRLLTQFAREAPDLAFARINVRALPTLEIARDVRIEEGMELATSGFPMGSDALAPEGYLSQISPTLQRGIVSAVLPFPGTHPHAFLLNVMVRGGASGSPVFFPESGKVAGIVYAGLRDFESSKACSYAVPTNLTYVLPAHAISTAVKILSEQGAIAPQPNAPTFASLMAEGQTDPGPHVVPWEPLPEPKREPPSL